ncbi:MAG: nucleotide-binding protein [Candidatus Cloacimonadota bacterium]|nr:MAG: nucleotide-binding protein [Candidatus Cloacimonadota bacterium]
MTIQYHIGIDLGTTNSSLAYSEIGDEKIQKYLIHQLNSEDLVVQKPVLPSIIYLPAENEFSEDSIKLPWSSDNKYIIGEMAKNQWGRAGYRVVHSAKSWLCHKGIDRKKSVLPFSSEIDHKISSFEATFMILNHIKDSWNFDYKSGKLKGLFEDQKIVITVPASFDPAARDLTLEAALEAGYDDVRLIEEPQAAFYSWIESHKDNWRDFLEIDKKILVCDIGGGTSDFSLIESTQKDKSLSLQRISVGSHILLGGDNMDLALAHFLNKKLKDDGKNPDQKQFSTLLSQARDAKEDILSGKKDSVEVILAGSGSSLFASSMKVILEKKDVDKLLLDGFFSNCEKGDKANKKRQIGFRKVGLDYAYDPSILRHLSEFLSNQEGGFLLPDYLLFNGSMFQAEILKDCIINGLKSWGCEDLKVLTGNEFTLAVSQGASYFSSLSDSGGIRIKASLPFSYYIAVEKSQMAIPGMEPELSMVCIAPWGLEEGESVTLKDEELYLVTGENIQFRLFRSHIRKDQAGDVIDYNLEDFEELSSVEKTLESTAEQSFIPVNLETTATEIGTLDLFCHEVDGQKEKWKLEFNVREEI